MVKWAGGGPSILSIALREQPPKTDSRERWSEAAAKTSTQAPTGAQAGPPQRAATARRRGQGATTLPQRQTAKTGDRPRRPPGATTERHPPAPRQRPAHARRTTEKRPQRGGTRHAANPPRQQTPERATQLTSKGKRARSRPPSGQARHTHRRAGGRRRSPPASCPDDAATGENRLSLA